MFTKKNIREIDYLYYKDNNGNYVSIGKKDDIKAVVELIKKNQFKLKSVIVKFLEIYGYNNFANYLKENDTKSIKELLRYAKQ